jgi:hypothetical protein
MSALSLSAAARAESTSERQVTTTLRRSRAGDLCRVWLGRWVLELALGPSLASGLFLVALAEGISKTVSGSSSRKRVNGYDADH